MPCRADTGRPTHITITAETCLYATSFQLDLLDIANVVRTSSSLDGHAATAAGEVLVLVAFVCLFICFFVCLFVCLFVS